MNAEEMLRATCNSILELKKIPKILHPGIVQDYLDGGYGDEADFLKCIENYLSVQGHLSNEAKEYLIEKLESRANLVQSYAEQCDDEDLISCLTTGLFKNKDELLQHLEDLGF